MIVAAEQGNAAVDESFIRVHVGWRQAKFIGVGRAGVANALQYLVEFFENFGGAGLIVTMAGALVGDLLLLPACLILFSKKTHFPASDSEVGGEEEALSPPRNCGTQGP